MKYRVWVVCLVLIIFCASLSFAQSSPRRIEIHAQRFSFVPAEITVKKGETVTLALTSNDVPHSLLIKDLNINGAMTKGHVTEVNFTPQTVGDFKGRCGRFCGSGHGSMLFVVHVVDN